MWLTLILEFLKIGAVVLKEIFEQKRIAREKNEKYELNQQKLYEIVQQVISKLKSSIQKESSQAQSMEDRIDKK